MASSATLLIINNVIVFLLLITVSILCFNSPVTAEGTTNSSSVGAGDVPPAQQKVVADPNGAGSKSDVEKENTGNDEKSEAEMYVDQEEEVILKSSPGKTKEVVDKYIVDREPSEKNNQPVAVDVPSSSSFLTYFIVLVIIVAIVYIAFHNRHKIMAYVIEGRRVRSTGQRRTTSTSGASTEYRPLTTADELSTGRIQPA